MKDGNWKDGNNRAMHTVVAAVVHERCEYDGVQGSACANNNGANDQKVPQCHLEIGHHSRMQYTLNSPCTLHGWRADLAVDGSLRKVDKNSFPAVVNCIQHLVLLWETYNRALYSLQCLVQGCDSVHQQP